MISPDLKENIYIASGRTGAPPEHIKGVRSLLRFGLASDITGAVQRFRREVDLCQEIGTDVVIAKMEDDPHFALKEGVLRQGFKKPPLDLKKALEEGKFTEGEVRDYHLHYFDQGLNSDSERAPILRFDNPLQSFYKTNNGRMPWRLGKGKVDSIFPGFIENWGSVVDVFAERRDEVLPILDEQGLLVIANHPSWMNLPEAAAAMQKAYGVKRENTIIVVGPRLTMTWQNLAMACSQGNVVKLIPPTPHGRLPTHLKSMQDGINKRGNRTLLKALKTPGNLVILCPPGTTDGRDSETGDFLINAANDGVLKSVRVLNNAAPVMAVGMNDIEIFKGSQLPRRGASYVNIAEKIYNPKSLKEEDAQVQIFKDLVDGIVGANEAPMGKLLLPERL